VKLHLLFAQGRITKDHPEPVLIFGESEAVAASLIENRECEIYASRTGV
jgi:hypothetical protein